jgi:hypothetical protein
MFRHYLQSKNLSAKAISAFLSIAVSGVLCLCCFQFSRAEAKADSCPLQKTSHCAKSASSETSDQAAKIVNSSECCALKLNVFLATLEKNQFPQQTSVAANNFFDFFQSAKLENGKISADFSYRPPIFDSRDLRLKNCVFRI